MLKIAEYNKKTGKKIKLKELEEYNFKKKYYYNAYVLESETEKQDVVFDLRTKKLLFCNFGYDTLYDLINDGYIEKVEIK